MRTTPENPSSVSQEASAVGYDWNVMRCRLLWYYRHAPQSYRSHADTVNVILWHLIAGNVRVKFADLELVAHTGEWVVLTRGRRVQEFSSDAYIESLHLHLETGSAEWSGPAGAVLAGAPGLEAVVTEISNLVHAQHPQGLDPGERVFQARDLVEQAATQQMIWDLAGSLFTVLRQAGVQLLPPDLSDPRLARSLAALDAMPAAQPWDRDRFARLIGLSSSQLDRVWRRSRGQTPYQYWDGRRLHFARERLENSGWSIKEIASALGFAHLAQFSNWFHERQGQSPRNYRKLFGR